MNPNMPVVDAVHVELPSDGTPFVLARCLFCRVVHMHHLGFTRCDDETRGYMCDDVYMCGTHRYMVRVPVTAQRIKGRSMEDS
jgi:hypothetical protein